MQDWEDKADGDRAAPAGRQRFLGFLTRVAVSTMGTGSRNVKEMLVIYGNLWQSMAIHGKSMENLWIWLIYPLLIMVI